MHCYRNVVISIPHNYSNNTWYYYFQTFLLSCIYWKWRYVVFDRRAIHVTCTTSPIFFFSHNIYAFELIYVLGEPRNTYLWNASSVVGSCVAATRLIFLLLVLVWQQQWFFSYWWFLCGSSKTYFLTAGSCVAAAMILFLLLVLVWQQQDFFLTVGSCVAAARFFFLLLVLV